MNRQIEFDQLITVDGETYRFNNKQDKFVWGITGQGMPPIEYRTQRGPFQDGETPLGFVLRPRSIGLIHRYNNCNRQGYWDNRSELMDILRPNRQLPGQFQGAVLRKILPNGDKRDLCVFIDSGPNFRGSNRNTWDEFSVQEALRFIAHDPTFFDPDKNVQDLTLPTSGEDEWALPFEFSIQFSSDGSAQTDTVMYDGTYKSYPTIIMQGPLTNPVVQNISTGEKIKLETTITDNTTVTISLEPGNKTIFDDLGNNLIGFLTTDSDLATFHLAPDPEVTDGANLFGVAASAIDAGSRIAIEWFTRYIGI